MPAHQAVQSLPPCAIRQPSAASADGDDPHFSPAAGVACAADAVDATTPRFPTCEGSPEMFIWRNLDPKILAQLLVQASALWKARNAVTRKQRDGSAAARGPAGKDRGRPAGTGDV